MHNLGKNKWLLAAAGSSAAAACTPVCTDWPLACCQLLCTVLCLLSVVKGLAFAFGQAYLCAGQSHWDFLLLVAPV
jgi:hypothetical protein